MNTTDQEFGDGRSSAETESYKAIAARMEMLADEASELIPETLSDRKRAYFQGKMEAYRKAAGIIRRRA
jgi:hypothetical protein